jgi:hypothetical protein
MLQPLGALLFFQNLHGKLSFITAIIEFTTGVEAELPNNPSMATTWFALSE